MVVAMLIYVALLCFSFAALFWSLTQDNVWTVVFCAVAWLIAVKLVIEQARDMGIGVHRHTSGRHAAPKKAETTEKEEPSVEKD